MVNQVNNNMMNSMAPMGAAPQTTMSMGMAPQTGFGGVQPMSGAPMGGASMGGAPMGGATMSAAPMGGGAMAPMSLGGGAGMMAPGTPTSSTNNAANAMPATADPFASLGALTGIAPK